jgi:hypothetical protein
MTNARESKRESVGVLVAPRRQRLRSTALGDEHSEQGNHLTPVTSYHEDLG